MKKTMKTFLRNAIIGWFDNSFKEYKGLDDPKFIKKVCEEIGISEEFYSECVLKENFKETDACLITEDMSSSEIFTNLSNTQKDDIYRMVWSDHVAEDVRAHMEENMLPSSSDIIQEIAEEVANRYVYNCDYDCNASYWQNIENLIDEEIDKPDERIFQFLYESSEAEDGVGDITCKITGSTGNIAAAAWLWQAAIGFSNAVFRSEDITMTLLKEDFNEREIDYLYEVFPDEISCDPITAYTEVLEKYKSMGLTVEYIEYTDDVDVVSSHGVY